MSIVGGRKLATHLLAALFSVLLPVSSTSGRYLFYAMENEIAHDWNLVAYCIQEYRQIEDPEKRSLYFDDYLYLPFLELAKVIAWSPDYALMLISEAATEIDFWDGSTDCFDYFNVFLRSRKFSKQEKLSEYLHRSLDAPFGGGDENVGTLMDVLGDKTEFNYYFDEIEEAEPEQFEALNSYVTPDDPPTIHFRATAPIPHLPPVNPDDFNTFKEHIRSERREMYQALAETRKEFERRQRFRNLEWVRLYREEHRDEYRRYGREYYYRHRTERLAAQAEYRAKNKTYFKEWAKSHPEKVKAGLEKYREKNKEILRAKALARYHANKEKNREVHRQRALAYRTKNIELVRAKDRERNRIRRETEKQGDLQLA
jgi:hypothetical protein